jgi:hypothetical protein
MYDILNPTSFSKSPFQYARMAYLTGRVDENFQKYVDTRRQAPGRLDSAHLLMKILSSLTVKFTGDLFSYMRDVDVAARSICSSLGITTSYNAGGMFTEGLFYPECPEIIIYTRNPKHSPMDLWSGWQTLAPVEVVTHPVTDMTVFEPAVKNSVTMTGHDLAIISIDIPLLAGQWKMWQTANPGKLMENYLTTIVLPNMMRSHLNVVIFNKLMVRLGIRKPVEVKTNLPFAQTPTNKHADDIVNEVYDKVSIPRLTSGQILDSIPVVYGSSYLNSVSLSSMTPTSQVIWALISQKVDPMAVVLQFGKITGYDKLVSEIIHVKRTMIEIKESKLLSSGLTTAESVFLTERFDRMVTQALPAA